MKKNRQSQLDVKWIMRLLSCAVFFSLAGYVLQSEWTRIEKIELEQAANTSSVLFERIRNSVQPELIKNQGRRMWDLSLKDVRAIVRKDRRVKDVSIRREFPGRLLVTIEPYSPVLSYFDTDGKFYPVAKDATLLPAVSTQDGFDVPILRGEGLRENMELRDAAINLFEQIPQQGAINQKSVSEIVYNKGEGFKVFLSGANTEVKLGDTDLGLKISRVGKVLSYLENQNVKSRVIDARFAKKVVVRARNAP